MQDHSKPRLPRRIYNQIAIWIAWLHTRDLLDIVGLIIFLLFVKLILFT